MLYLEDEVNEGLP